MTGPSQLLSDGQGRVKPRVGPRQGQDQGGTKTKERTGNGQGRDKTKARIVQVYGTAGVRGQGQGHSITSNWAVARAVTVPGSGPEQCKTRVIKSPGKDRREKENRALGFTKCRERKKLKKLRTEKGLKVVNEK